MSNKKPRGTDSCCPAPKAGEDLRPVEGKKADEELATLAKAAGHPEPNSRC